MEHFTPFSALAGGVLIGLSAALLLATNGRIAGISGILGGAVAPRSDGRLWRLTFLFGLIAGSFVAQPLSGISDLTLVAGTPAMIVAGALVGIGTRLGNGCTSGHGVCGIARLSPRSIAATMTFMLTGGLTVFVVRHVIGG
jgi:uncharacterized membrane protein YedE/YeeE